MLGVRVAAIAIAFSALATPVPASADERPATLPALVSFTPSSGTFALRPDARVVIHPSERAALRGEARLLAGDLGALLHRSIRTARGRARRGDVLLTLRGRDPGLGEEGYALRVGRVFTIAAGHNAGVFYGGRTLLQLLRGGAAIPRGHARDVPRYQERGLMVDCGRAFYDRAWWLEEIRRVSDLKLNLIHLHLSDDQGFRVEVPSHPEIVSAQHLSLGDVRAIVAEAQRRHVTLVPEIDMPGHMTAALARHPELQLANAAGQRQPDKLDVTLPAARVFAHQILADLLGQFPGSEWHLGADEYLGIASTPADYYQYPQLEAYARARYGGQANGKDAVLDFVNDLAGQVEHAGRRPHVWSDGVGGGSAVRLDPRVVVEWWENLHSPSPQALVADHRDVVNVGWWPLYYVTGGTFQRFRATEQDMYEHWQPSHFEGPYTLRWFTGAPMGFDLDPGVPAQLGATLAVWNDDPSAPGAQPAPLARGIQPRLEILAQQTWGSPKLTPDYAAFGALATRLTGVPSSISATAT
jgi:hexosaminidase